MKKILSIISVILIISSLLCLNVSAENNQTEYVVQSGTVLELDDTVNLIWTEDYYFAPEGYENVMVFGNSANKISASKFFLLYYADNEITQITNAQIKGKFYLIDFTTEEQITEILFNGKYKELDMHYENGYLGSLASYYLYVSDEYSKIYASQSAPLTLAEYFVEWTEAGNVYVPETPTPENNTEYQNGVLGWFQKLWDGIKAIPEKIGELIDVIVSWFDTLVISVQALPDRIAEFFSLDIVIDEDSGESLHIGEYMFQVVENRIETGTLSEGDGEFYNTVFGFGQRFNAFLRQDFSKPPDMELLTVDLSKNESSLPLGNEKVSLMDLSWYGRYKPMVDTFISCFLWMGFIFMLWRNLPNFVSGQGAGFSDSYTGYVKLDENIHGKTTVTRTVTVDNKTGKTIDTTATSNRKRGK